MNLGTALLAISVAAGTLLALLSFAPPTPLRERAQRRALLAHASAGAGALAWMTLLFLASDVRTAYVWDHTRADYPLAYKLAGLWGGQDGTLLLWGGLVALLAQRVARGPGAQDALASRFLALLSTALLGIALAVDAFRPTSAASLAFAPGGAGLADVLVTPLMVIHPPIQFLAYALIAVPAAYALAHWLAGDARASAWVAPAYAWARAAWLFATLGLGLGALWAYYVLSFGGYWAWDPVETSNLLPWLALTAFLHIGKTHLRHADHALAAPLLALLAHTLVLFATFATRSGLWVSVHAFTDPTQRFEPDAALRLLEILDAHLPTRVFLAMLTTSLFAGLALLLAHHAPALPRAARAYARAHALALAALAGLAALDVRALYGALFEAARATGLGVPAGFGALAALLVGLPPTLLYLAREEPAESGWRLDTRRLLAGAGALLGVALGVAFLLNLQVVNGQDRALFDARAPLVALPLVALLTVALGLAPLGRTRALLLSALGLAVGLAGAWLLPDARVLALCAPPLAAAALAALLRLVHVQGRRAPPRARLAGLLLLASSLLALVMWSNPPSRLLGLELSEWGAVALGVAGFALGALGLAGSFAALRARGRGLALAGAAAATLAAGYAVGALLGLAALALLLPASRGFASARGMLRDEAGRVRESGVWLLHLALVLGLLGYAGSTYSQEGETFTAVAPGDALALGDIAVAVGDAETERAPDGRIHALAHDVTLLREGETWERATLRLSWDEGTTPAYRAELDVRRTLLADVYVQPLALHTAEDGWVGEGHAQPLTGERVDALTFRVSVLPLMTLVWAGLWTMVLAMGLVLVGARLERAAPARRVPVQEGAPSRPLLEEA